MDQSDGDSVEEVDDMPAVAVAEDDHVGPEQGAIRPCSVRGRHCHESVLRGSAFAVTETDE